MCPLQVQLEPARQLVENDHGTNKRFAYSPEEGSRRRNTRGTTYTLTRLYFTTSSRIMVQGAGALVRRSIGSMNLKNLTPFLMLDHFHVSKGAVRDPPLGRYQ